MKHAIETAGVSGHWPVFMGAIEAARNGVKKKYESSFLGYERVPGLMRQPDWWQLTRLAYTTIRAGVKTGFHGEVGEGE